MEKKLFISTVAGMPVASLFASVGLNRVAHATVAGRPVYFYAALYGPGWQQLPSALARGGEVASDVVRCRPDFGKDGSALAGTVEVARGHSHCLQVCQQGLYRSIERVIPKDVVSLSSLV